MKINNLKKTSLKENSSEEYVYRLFIECLCRNRSIMLKPLMDNFEKKIIIHFLAQMRGNQKNAAKSLGIKYTTLNEKIKRYGIQYERS